jgi:hypothetical protein
VFWMQSSRLMSANPRGRTFDIDVGIYCFGGRAYLEIRDGKATPVDCRVGGHGEIGVHALHDRGITPPRVS